MINTKNTIDSLATFALRDAATMAEKEALKQDASNEVGALGQAAGLEMARRLRWAAHGYCPGGAVRPCKPLRATGARGYTRKGFRAVLTRLTARLSASQ